MALSQQSQGSNLYLPGLGLFIKPKSLGADCVAVIHINSPQEDLPAWEFRILSEP